MLQYFRVFDILIIIYYILLLVNLLASFCDDRYRLYINMMYGF